MTNEQDHVITIELPATEIDNLVSLLKREDLSPTVFEPQRLSGGLDFVTVVLPISIGAIQVVATFLSSWIESRKDSPGASSGSSLRVLIDDIVIEASNLTPDHVERIIGQTLGRSSNRLRATRKK